MWGHHKSTICPCPGLQRKRAAAALSQAGRAGPNQPIRAIQTAGHTRRPLTGCTVRNRQDRRQTASSLNAPWVGHNNPPDKYRHERVHNFHMIIKICDHTYQNFMHKSVITRYNTRYIARHTSLCSTMLKTSSISRVLSTTNGRLQRLQSVFFSAFLQLTPYIFQVSVLQI